MSNPPSLPHIHLAAALLAFSLVFLLQGCGSRATMRIEGVQTGEVLAMRLPLASHTSRGERAADIYLTTLTRDELDPGTPLEELEGHLIHINLFLVPHPGRTPIDAGASNVTIRHVVFARGAVGVYGGGGFMLTRTKPGASYLRGRIGDATIRVTDQSPAFRDPLGPGRVSFDIRAPKDETLARLIAGRLDEALDRLQRPR